VCSSSNNSTHSYQMTCIQDRYWEYLTRVQRIQICCFSLKKRSNRIHLVHSDISRSLLRIEHIQSRFWEKLTYYSSAKKKRRRQLTRHREITCPQVNQRKILQVRVGSQLWMISKMNFQKSRVISSSYLWIIF